MYGPRRYELSFIVALSPCFAQGIGKETVRVLAAGGANVLLGARNEKLGNAAVEEIKAAIPGAQVRFVRLDLADQAQIRECADALLAAGTPLSILVNNAGIMAPPLGYTKDGFETQWGVNHLGPFGKLKHAPEVAGCGFNESPYVRFSSYKAPSSAPSGESYCERDSGHPVAAAMLHHLFVYYAFAFIFFQANAPSRVINLSSSAPWNFGGCSEWEAGLHWSHFALFSLAQSRLLGSRTPRLIPRHSTTKSRIRIMHGALMATPSTVRFCSLARSHAATRLMGSRHIPSILETLGLRISRRLCQIIGTS